MNDLARLLAFVAFCCPVAGLGALIAGVLFSDIDPEVMGSEDILKDMVKCAGGLLVVGALFGAVAWWLW